MEFIKLHWTEILNILKKEYDISDTAFKTWLLPLNVIRVEDDTVYISCNEADNFFINIIRKKYYNPLKVTISEFCDHNYEVEFIIEEDSNDQSSPSVNEAVSNSKNYINSNLNSKYTFDTFIVGSNNRFAHNAALAVAESPGDSYNPLFIYGGAGLGKTHLMHAIGNYIISQNPSTNVLYVTSESFVNEVVEGIKSSKNSNAMMKLREKYRTVDVLMIDDIQFLIGREATQEEFFHTFNDLHSAGKQIILTSDKSPKEMETLEERIKSRFEWGLMADIGYPDYETRMAILKSKAEAENFYLDNEIMDYIASNIKSNIREIEGALNKLIAYKKLQNNDITMETAIKELKNFISPDKPVQVTPQLIIEMVSEHYNISLDQMISKSRTSNIAKPRQIAMYLCKTMTDSPLEAIGHLLGGRDHSTIIHGCKKIEEDYMTDPELKSQIDIIKKKIYPN